MTKQVQQVCQDLREVVEEWGRGRMEGEVRGEEGEGGGGGGREREEVGERGHLLIWLQSAHGLLALDAGELSAGLKRDGSLREE